MNYDGDKELAWHFLADNGKGRPVMRDGTPMVVGRWYEHSGELVMCEAGYHASTRAIDALTYAPGPWVSLCEVDGRIIRGDNKVVCTRRRALWAHDATEQLRLFARNCALEVADLWKMPAIVRKYLETGREDIRDAAWAATGNAVKNAVRDAASIDTWDVVEDNARAAAWNATGVPAWFAARNAAWAWVSARNNGWTPADDAIRGHQNATLESLLFAGIP